MDVLKYLRSGGSLKNLIKSKIVKYADNLKAAADEIAVGIKTAGEVLAVIINCLKTVPGNIVKFASEIIDEGKNIIIKLKEGGSGIHQ